MANPEQLVDLGFIRSSVVMVNAAAANAGRRLPHHDDGYLAQPEMRALIADALELGWTLIAYETTDLRA